MMLQYISISSQLPKVGYVKGIDVLLLGCLLFLGVILLEYTFLMSLMRGKTEESPAPSLFRKRRKWDPENGDDVLTLFSLIMRVDALLKWAIFVLFVTFVTLYFLFTTGYIAHDSQGFAPRFAKE